MNKKELIIEIDGDIEEQFLSLSYILKVENGTSNPLSIQLYEIQCQENYLFEILSSCGISFIKKVFIMNYSNEEIKDEYLKANNNILIESTGASKLIIENTGNLVLSAESDEIIPSGFTIYTSMGPEPEEPPIRLLCNILNEIGVSYEIK
tara:strand:+ start:263 stop:712 length:450 start_codon:yes stop_codon:yes gene_type:complete